MDDDGYSSSSTTCTGSPREALVGLSRLATGILTGCLLVRYCWYFYYHCAKTAAVPPQHHHHHHHHVNSNNVCNEQRATSSSSSSMETPLSIIPFIYIASSESSSPSSNNKAGTIIDRAIQSSLAQFRNEASQAVQGMSRALEKALEFEYELDISISVPKALLLSTKLEKRIHAMAACLEADETLLEKILLSGFQPTLALPDVHDSSPSSMTMENHHQPKTKTTGHSSSTASVQKKCFHQVFPATATTSRVESSSSSSGSSSSSAFILSTPYQQQNKKRLRNMDGSSNNVYDATGQIIAHLVRDWTRLGTAVRHSLYDWCLEQLLLFHGNQQRGGGPVLVPGAGMGRLAYTLYQHGGFTVEANELSPVMAAASQAILQRGASGIVHPFLLDRLSNEVDSQRRLDAVPFPDVPIILQRRMSSSSSSSSSSSGSLSFTIADFSHYSSPQYSQKYKAVVTCFFLDTASNIYEYLDRIRNILVGGGGGIWINVGPLQWHRNAMTFPAADELRDLMVAFGFQIVHWSVDGTPVAYRDQEEEEVAAPQFVRTTNFDGYRPVRFVAIRGE